MADRRVILHSDMNSFYASVEAMLDPSLKGKAVAVCGATEERHGIVLAKSELAKKAGVKTGMVNWEAKQRCPELILVPPQYDQYLKYSKMAHQIYNRYTDLVEPFGMDECWLDMTGSRTFGTGMEIAQKIRTACREELGLTVSIGVSFNKIFAKLGSDMKKPDAVTEITRDNFQDLVWPLDASELIYVGRATRAKLARYGVLAAKLVCADCGEFFGPKTWHSTDKYRKVIWRCTHKYEGESRCGTPHLNEEDVKERFVTAVNSLISDMDTVLEECRVIQDIASDCTAMDKELAELSQEMEVVAELTRRCIEENSCVAQDQTAFQERYNGLVERYDTAKARYTELTRQRKERQDRADEIGEFMFEVSELHEPVQDFDEALWRTIVERVTVNRDGGLLFRFTCGHEVLV